MKTILCLLAVLCAVNAKSLRLRSVDLAALTQQLAIVLQAEGIDGEGFKELIEEAIEEAMAFGLTIAKIEMMADGFLRNGCQNGFVVWYDRELEEQLNDISPVICPELEKIKADIAAVGESLGPLLGDAAQVIADTVKVEETKADVAAVGDSLGRLLGDVVQAITGDVGSGDTR